MPYDYCGFCSNRILFCFLLSVCMSVTGVTSHIAHIYKGIYAMWIIRGPINPMYMFYLSSKDQTRQDHRLRPDQTDHRFWLIQRIIKKTDAESAVFAVFTLSCLLSLLSSSSQLWAGDAFLSEEPRRLYLTAFWTPLSLHMVDIHCLCHKRGHPILVRIILWSNQKSLPVARAALSPSIWSLY